MRKRVGTGKGMERCNSMAAVNRLRAFFSRERKSLQVPKFTEGLNDSKAVPKELILKFRKKNLNQSAQLNNGRPRVYIKKESNENIKKKLTRFKSVSILRPFNLFVGCKKQPKVYVVNGSSIYYSPYEPLLRFPYTFASQQFPKPSCNSTQVLHKSPQPNHKEKLIKSVTVKSKGRSNSVTAGIAYSYNQSKTQKNKSYTSYKKNRRSVSNIFEGTNKYYAHNFCVDVKNQITKSNTVLSKILEDAISKYPHSGFKM
eukprot:TRINITY_DN10968_c0_g1_i6.p1 TRINITY_DN10968_c0_g1~~TRINITY_DN10968_c0_g1_i6.p1  ORF type:complete len:257 (+),score=1.88 TRINITY_DN10968_c0_g1_i6:157-927(+)